MCAARLCSLVPAWQPLAAVWGIPAHPTRLWDVIAFHPWDQWVEGAAGRLKDKLPKAQHGGVSGVGTAWPGTGLVLCSVCWEGSGGHPPPGMVPPHTLLQPLAVSH